MAAPKGHKRYGGRVKGTPNKDTRALLEKAQELGVDPFEVLLMFAGGMHQELGYFQPIEPSVRARCAADACKYLYPIRKAIEVSENPDAPLGQASSNKHVEELKAHLERLAKEKRG